MVDLTAEDIVGQHAQLFGLTAQQASDRLRSQEALEGAVARPRQDAYYTAADLATQAAVLAHGIAEGQPVIDGNKRTAPVALLTFLEANDHTLGTTEPRLAHQIHRRSRNLSVDDFGDWIRASLRPRASRRSEDE